MQAVTQDEADRRLGGVVQVDDVYWAASAPATVADRHCGANGRLGLPERFTL